MRSGSIILPLLIFFFNASLNAQNNDEGYHRTVRWRDVQTFRYTDTVSSSVLMFDGANYFEKTGLLPVYFERIPLEAPVLPTVILTDEIFEALEVDDAAIRDALTSLPGEIKVTTALSYERKQPFLTFYFVPVRKNNLLGGYEKLTSFTVKLVYEGGQNTKSRAVTGRVYASSSVLATGNWYRIAVRNTGIHIIDYQLLTAMGIDPSSLDPRNIRLYGSGGKMLPENTGVPCLDDLQEDAIIVAGENDGHFDAGDYILFYGEGPVTWAYDPFSMKFRHTTHLYTDKTYYFLSTDLGPGKRITTESNSTLEPTDTVATYNDYASHELDAVNLIKSGRQWFGEVFDALTEYSFPFNFPDINRTSQASVKAVVVAHSTTNSSFTVSCDGHVASTSITAISTLYDSQYARSGVINDEFLPGGDQLNVTVRYNKPLVESIGWLDYLEVNVRRQLKMSGDQMPFRDAQSMGNARVATFILDNAASGITVWDLTDPLNIKKVDAVPKGNTLTFRLLTDTLREFIAFNGHSYFTPEFVEKVPNQNLHGLGQTDMVIVAHPLFWDQALRLAQHHADADGLNVVVVTPQQIYNEFSSGSQDVAAIRNFMKMFYDRAATGNEPRYLLLFGDGSYDNKNRMADNTDFIPTYQSNESFQPVVSYVTDDFYGMLDDGEGTGESDIIDLGIGRLPVTDPDEAKTAVDKIIYYSTASKDVMGDWRNMICFVADDEDNNLHLDQADNLANYIDTVYPEYNINKIYLDSYKEISTPGGQRYPDVNQAITDQVEQGALIMNYTGHGGEVGWAHERILELTDINSWKNINNMPIFITATCEFSRFDDPERVSAGEYVFLNPNGGGLALFSTSRPTYGSPNYMLNKSVYTYAFDKIDGKFPTMGDVFMLSKRENGSDNNGRKFILLGDPAQRLAYPQENIVTTTINFREITSIPDTIHALSEVVINGKVTDEHGNLLSGFNGIITTTVYDKPQEVSTLANDGGATRTFEVRKSILYKGKTTVTNGEFNLSFLVPKDIAYRYGYGKISYYAENGITDANGYTTNIVIGGYNHDYAVDDQGPTIYLYMNDSLFVNGGITDENPFLFAKVSDSSGINTVGNGIGHDITAILDNNSNDPRILNIYYESDINTYKSGTILYPFVGLSEGHHTIRLKVWDAFNNSSEATVDFIVRLSGGFSIEHLINYPNPFRDYTDFTFEHNKANRNLDIDIRIFSLAGKMIWETRKTVFADGYRSQPIRWNGCNQNGAITDNGVYIYHVTVTSDDGQHAEKSGKLIVSR